MSQPPEIWKVRKMGRENIMALFDLIKSRASFHIIIYYSTIKYITSYYHVFSYVFHVRFMVRGLGFMVYG